jgi:hypothetical protein
MTKYTKRQYLADLAINESALAQVRSELARYADRIEAGEPITEALTTAWNSAYDAEYAIKQTIAEIERRWSCRNWTYADYSAAELVSANID